jgi:hypothetical protein
VSRAGPREGDAGVFPRFCHSTDVEVERVNTEARQCARSVDMKQMMNGSGMWAENDACDSQTRSRSWNLAPSIHSKQE